MDIITAKTLFMWCTIINVLLLVISFLVCAFAGEWIYQMHSKWFTISREAFHIAIYSFLGLFKILLLVFNLIPYVACVIIG